MNYLKTPHSPRDFIVELITTKQPKYSITFLKLLIRFYFSVHYFNTHPINRVRTKTNFTLLLRFKNNFMGRTKNWNDTEYKEAFIEIMNDTFLVIQNKIEQRLTSCKYATTGLIKILEKQYDYYSFNKLKEQNKYVITINDKKGGIDFGREHHKN